MKAKQQGRIIKRLRSKIPESNCHKGCIECCGPVPWVFWEKKKIQSLVDVAELDPQKSVFSKDGISCPYCVQDIGCLVYEERPILCRIFGISEDVRIKCPKSKTITAFLSINQTHQIMNEYLNLNPRLMLEKVLLQVTGKKHKSYTDKHWG